MRYILPAAGSIFWLLVALLPTTSVTAATGIINPNGDGSSGNNWGSVPSGAFYSTVDDGVTQPTTPNMSDYMVIDNKKTDNAFLLTSTLSNVSSVSSITIWAYHNDGSNGTLHAALYDANESTAYGSDQTFTQRTSAAWDSVTIGGLSLTQSNLDGLRLRFHITKTSGSGGNAFIYATYAVVTYTASVLSADIVDSGGNPVTTPSVGMSTLDAGFNCQTSTGLLGTSSEKIRVSNTTINGNWTLSVAPAGGSSALWSDGISNYDFNDPSGGGCDNGQLIIDPSLAGLSSSCSTGGLSSGSSMAFSGSITDVTLITATGSQTSCSYDITNIGLTQMVPAEMPAGTQPYTLDLTLTVVAN